LKEVSLVLAGLATHWCFLVHTDCYPLTYCLHRLSLGGIQQYFPYFVAGAISQVSQCEYLVNHHEEGMLIWNHYITVTTIELDEHSYNVTGSNSLVVLILQSCLWLGISGVEYEQYAS